MRKAINISLVVLIVVNDVITGFFAGESLELRDRAMWLSMRADEVERSSIERDNTLFQRDNILYGKLISLVQMLIDTGVVKVPEDGERRAD